MMMSLKKKDTHRRIGPENPILYSYDNIIQQYSRCRNLPVNFTVQV